MKRDWKVTNGFLAFLLSMALTFSLAGCGGGGGGGGTSDGGGGGATTTTISGKVTLSSTVGGSTALKARPKAMMAPMMAHATGKPFGKVLKGSPSSPGNRLGKVIEKAVSQAPSVIAGATVSLYDADHSEWLYPVAKVNTGSDGLFTLSTKNMNPETGAVDTSGATIPSGIYTLIAIGKDYSTSAVTTTTYPYYDTDSGKAYRNIVAIQAVVQKYEGAVTGNDLTVQSSDAIPQVVSIMGKKTGTLTTTTGGEYDLGTIASNAALQVIFDMAMHRVNTPTAITLMDSSGTTKAGTWKMSPDLTVATFYPTSALSATAKYKLVISRTATANYYGKGLKTDVTAVYTAGEPDTTQANAIFVSPDVQTGVDIKTSIKFAANEPIDVNTIIVTSTPSIGSKPTVKSLGYKDVTGQYDYGYQIIPSDPLQLNTDYAITVSGGKDLGGSGKDMTAVTANFKTAASSSGVTGTGGSVTDQADVKSVVGKWVDAMNAGDLNLFSSLLSGDLTFSFKQETRCDVGSPCNYDLNKDGSLSYGEFVKFLEHWFNDNAKITGWTGDSKGIHLTGDVAAGAEIKVDAATGIAAFNFVMTYKKADGSTYTGTGDNGVISLYLILKDINGSWYLSSLSEKDNTGVVGASIGLITTGTPIDGAALTQGTKTITFNWTPVTGATSYAVVLMDKSDPTGSTGWVGIINDSNITGTTAAFDYTSVSDLDATADGKVVFIGGGLNAPFSKELKLQDGGSYTWMVVGFKTLTASSFTTMMDKEPDADMLAMSSGASFSIGGTMAAGLTVTPKTSTGTALGFSDALYAWDAVQSDSVTLDITASSSASTGGKVYVYGNYYAEKAFTFTNGKATVSIDLFNGYNWIDVTDGVNWWYAITSQTHTTTSSNYIYTKGGVSYTQVTVDSVTSGGTIISPDAYGYYNINATSIVIKGKASASMVYIDNSTSTNYSTSTTAVTSGAYTATVDIYSGYNWISVNDGYGNWVYVNIYNAGAGAVYTAPISNVKVNGAGPDGGTGTTYTVNTNTDVIISGSLNVTGNGYWYKWSNTASASGTLFNTSGTFSFPILADSGSNYIDLYDANWNWYGITINNQAAATQPNTITAIDGVAQTATQNYYSYADTDCSVTINGLSPASAGEGIYVYLYNYSPTTGSIYDNQTVTADGSGNYTITQGIYGGTNYIDVYDANWNWQGIQVTTTATNCTPTEFAVTNVSPATWDSTNWYWNAGSASTVTVSGTAAAGKSITAYIEASSGVSNTYTKVTADSNGNFSFTGMPIYNGYNYISLTDGSNWFDTTVYTTGGATYTSPISGVSVSSSTLTSGGATSDSWSQWDTSAGAVTITGNGTNGTGTYYQSGAYTSTSGDLVISNGTFTLPVNLEYGYTYISLYDANGNAYYVTIYTTGGTGAPVKVVAITTPVHNSTQSGSINVSGTVDTTSFTPVYVYGYVYDYNTYHTTYYSNDPADVSSGWAQPLTYSAGTFSFTATVNAGNPTQIEVSAWPSDYDANYWSHGNGIYVNQVDLAGGWGSSDYSWKPGSTKSKANANAAREKAHKAEFLKKVMKRK